jgi:hypothetical protein
VEPRSKSTKKIQMLVMTAMAAAAIVKYLPMPLEKFIRRAALLRRRLP